MTRWSVRPAAEIHAIQCGFNNIRVLNSHSISVPLYALLFHFLFSAAVLSYPTPDPHQFVFTPTCPNTLVLCLLCLPPICPAQLQFWFVVKSHVEGRKDIMACLGKMYTIMDASVCFSEYVLDFLFLHHFIVVKSTIKKQMHFSYRKCLCVRLH